MRKALVNTKVTVKLRKSVHHADEWYLFIESYPRFSSLFWGQKVNCLEISK